MAYLVGVGAAAAIGGSVVGTIFPQVSASMRAFADNDLFERNRVHDRRTRAVGPC